MASIIKVNDIQDAGGNSIISSDGAGNFTTGFSTTPTDGSITLAKLSTSATESENVDKRVVKAYVHFNGTGTLSVNESFNVSSVTDNGTGDYTANFIANMSSSTFPCTALCGDLAYGSTTALISQTSSTMKVRTISNDIGTGLSDAVRCTFIVFGDLS